MSSEDYLKDISEIKDLMNKSSRFISLSGLSGILAGIYALIGAAIAYFFITPMQHGDFRLEGDVPMLILLDLFLVCFFGVITGIILTTRKAKKEDRPIWGPASKNLVINFLIPVVSGGIFTLIVLSQHNYGIISALMLLFYGLGLVNASKYTLGDVRYLGYTEIILGLLCAYLPGYGFWFWVIGFGLMHIIYGTLMYFKYEKS